MSSGWSGNVRFPPIPDISLTSAFDPLRTLGSRRILTLMVVPLRLVVFAACTLAISACDPGVRLAYEQEIRGPVDADCVEQAVKAVVPDVRRTSYVSDGRDGFGSGTKVLQLLYDLEGNGGYSLQVGPLSNGRFLIQHEWNKLGTDITEQERASSLPLLGAVNMAMSERCGISWAGAELQEG